MANRRPAGDGMVRQKKRGQWEGRITVGHKSDGKPIFRYVYGKTQKETLEKLHQRIEDYRGVELTEDSKMTLGEWLDRWLNEYMIFTIRESLWDSYASMIRKHVSPYLGDKPVAFITTADVQRMYNKIKKNGRHEAHPLRGHELADSTVRSVHMMLHEAMDAAVRERLIVKNPTDGTTIPKNNYAPKQILTETQLDKFMRIAMQDEVWRDFFYTELTTGLHLGEICGLRWSDFDEATGRLKISRTVKKKKGGGVTWGDTKTETGMRNILLPPSTAEILRERKKTAMSEWIFPNIYRPEEAMHPEYPCNRMKTLLKQAGLPLIRFHDLRHTFATMALENGMDVKTLSATIGHVSAATTLDIYSHMTDTMQMQAAVSIDRKIGGTNAQMPVVEQTPEETAKPPVNAPCAPTEPHPEPVPRKIRKSGTGCLYQINDNLWEGSFFPRLPNGKRKKFNVYAETKEQCEIKLAEMIERIKAEIAEEKEKRKEGAE